MHERRIVGSGLLALLAILVSLPTARGVQAAGDRYAQLKERAERLVAEGSWASARDLYLQADAMDLPADAARWVDFRLADTQWRSVAATNNPDDTELEQARRALVALVEAIDRPSQRDLVWAEAQTSLGDWMWARQRSRNFGAGWPHYQQALDYWAGSSDLALARTKYLGLVRRMVAPPWTGPDSWNVGSVPLDVLENAIRISDDETDARTFSYLAALTLRHQANSIAQRNRLVTHFERALEGRPSDPWHDDALWAYGQWREQAGRIVRLPGGQWRPEADYEAALTLYRRLLEAYRPGESRYVDDARRAIDQITGPRLDVYVTNAFLPGSEVQAIVNWRNVADVELRLFPIDLVDDVAFPDGDRAWADAVDVARRDPLRRWSEPTGDRGDHQPGGLPVRLDPRPGTGAYLLEATGGGKTSRALVLVTDATLLVKSSPETTVVWCTDAGDGAPIEGARVRLWGLHRERHDRWAVREVRGVTDADGLCRFDVAPGRDWEAINVTAQAGDRPALATARRNSYGVDGTNWKIYAFTDRPAYRPGETVKWKAIARRVDAGVTTTPEGEPLYWEITGPQGEVVAKGTAVPNAFGSLWADVELTESMRLGAYDVAFYADESKHGSRARSTLFRLEEYKLPEFRVEVKTPTRDGTPMTFQVGDVVQVDIAAEYYFGGPVAGAEVEAVVHQRPFSHWWSPPRDFPWCYEPTTPQWNRWWGPGQVVERRTLATDAEGRAQLTFDTPAGANQDFEYTIEARVVDASRREITGRGSVKVTRQHYFAYLRPEQHVVAPGASAEVLVKTIDPNDNPVAAVAHVEIVREQWREIWLDPAGREVTGEQRAETLRHRRGMPPPPDGDGWMLIRRGWDREVIERRTERTGADGEARVAFRPDEPGYYRFTWRSPDAADPTELPDADDQTTPWVVADTIVWCADRDTGLIRHHAGGVEIVADRDTFHVGQSAPVMLAVPGRDRHVLFTVEGEALHAVRHVHVAGNVKLVEVDITEAHVPNVVLTASMIADAQFLADRADIVVPPVEQYLDVEVETDRDAYEPRETGLVTVRATDRAGAPVRTELALAVFDQSVTYIADDPAGDPRAFFFKGRQGHVVQTSSSLNALSYVTLVEGPDGSLVDARQLAALREKGRNEEFFGRLDTRGDAGAVYEGLASGRGGGAVAGTTAYADDERIMLGQQVMRNAGAPPAPMSAAKAGLAMERAEADAYAPAGEPGAPADGGAIELRTDFRSTVLWMPDVVTDADGRATVEVSWPDSLTTWVAVARGGTTGNRFGIGRTTARTRKPLIARLQAPRFFVVGDETTLSAVLNNNTDEDFEVDVALDAPHFALGGMRAGKLVPQWSATVTVPAGGERRVDWRVLVEEPGESKITLTADGGRYRDGMVRAFPIHEHGVPKLLARALKLRPGDGDEATIALDLPARADGSTELSVQVSTSMAVTMLDALPYLVDYPYGCTEQTMSRFLPAAITAATLRDVGLDPEDAMTRVFGGIEPEHADATHPKGRRALTELDAMVRRGLERLADFQHGDGGWGWWKGGDSDRFMTAYALWGLVLADGAGHDVNATMMERAVRWLEVQLVEDEFAPDRQAWMLHALAAWTAHTGRRPTPNMAAAFDNCYERREGLNAYTTALLALAADGFGDDARAQVLARNLRNGVRRDDRPDTSIVIGTGASQAGVQGTAHWGADGVWWRWSDGPVEATSFALRALLAIDPGSDLVEPVTNWLVKNRRGAQWSNTRDTAIAVLALNDYLRASGELDPRASYEVRVNGTVVQTVAVTPADALSAPRRIVVDPALVRDGRNTIVVRRTDGDAPLYVAARAAFFSAEEPIAAAGNEIFVRRDYHKLVPKPTLLKGYVYDRVKLTDEDYVTSGERVEVTLTVECKNDYEYLVFEDLKPAGFEAVEVRSGEGLQAQELRSGAVRRAFAADESGLAPQDRGDAIEDRSDYTGRSRWVHQELRDRKVACFVDRLPEGVWQIRYELRAEVPGRYHGLPLLGHAMYVPEIRANGDEIRVRVEE